MALLSLDRHDVLETIRQSNSLHEAFLRVAKLPAVGEYRTATNADRIRAMTDEELAIWLADPGKTKDMFPDIPYDIAPSYVHWLYWLKEEVKGESE